MKKLLIGAFVGYAAFAAIADEIQFKSGARLLGEVVGIDGQTITFKSEDVGEIKVKAEKIATMTTDKKSVVLFTNKTRKDVTIGITDGEFTAEGERIDMADVKAVNPEEKWHGSVTVGATVTRGNTVSEDVAIAADVSRRWEDDRFTASGEYNWSQNGTSKATKQKTQDKITLAEQWDHFLSEKVYGYENGKFERDTINGLSSRYRLGLGLGYQWLDGYEIDDVGKFSFSQEAGFEWVKERQGKSDDYASFRYKHTAKWLPACVDDVEVFHNFEFHPEVGEFSNHVINTDIGAQTKIWGGWNLLAKFEWDYDNEPAPGAKKSDLRYILGLGYKW